MNYGEKLRMVRKKLGLSQQELGQKIDVATMVVSRLESNDTSLKASLLTKLDTMGINITWLLTGQGTCLKSSLPEEFSDSQTTTYSIPIVDVQASAGLGILNENELIIGTTEIGLEFKSYWGRNVVIIKISGDSMAPTIPKNSWILVQKTTTLKSEGVFIFLQDNELRCKRIQKKGTGDIIVKSDNPLYEAEIYPKNSNLGELLLLGEVVGIMNKI